MIWSTVCGSYTVYAIEDGHFFREPLEQFPNSDPAAWRIGNEGRLRLSVGCFFLTDGTRNILVDTGIGDHASFLGADARGGELISALAMLEIAPESIDAVIHTHLHIDHCGGDVSATGELLFPRASYWIHRRELDYWSTVESPVAKAAREVLGVIGERVEAIDSDTEVVAGLTAVETPGHTPGHVSVSLGSGHDRVFVTGDVTHHPVQVEHPEWAIPFDVDRQQATAQRRKVFDQLEGSGVLMAAGHYPRPGLGYVEDLDGQRFVAAVMVQVA